MTLFHFKDMVCVPTWCLTITLVASFHVKIDLVISVLDVGIKFSYQVPSFPVIIVDLRKIKMQLTAEDGCLILSDGFMKADQSVEMKIVPFSKIHI